MDGSIEITGDLLQRCLRRAADDLTRGERKAARTTLAGARSLTPPAGFVPEAVVARRMHALVVQALEAMDRHDDLAARQALDADALRPMLEWQRLRGACVPSQEELAQSRQWFAQQVRQYAEGFAQS